MSATGYVSYLFFQKKSFHKSGYYLLVAGFVCHFTALGYGFIESGHLPVRDLRETLMLTAWAVAGVFLAFQYKFKLRILGIFAAPLTVLIMVVASQLPNDPLQAESLFNSFLADIPCIVCFNRRCRIRFGLRCRHLVSCSGALDKNKKSGLFFQTPSLIGTARFNRIYLHYCRLYPSHHGIDRWYCVCQIDLGSFLELGSERGLDWHHMAGLRRIDSTTSHDGMARQESGDIVDYWICNPFIHLFLVSIFCYKDIMENLPNFR